MITMEKVALLQAFPKNRKGCDLMAGKTEYKNKWQADNCERISLVVPKGKKDEYKQHASGRGETLNGFIKRAIDETMERDGSGNGAAVGGKE